MADQEEVVIVGEDGTEHVFPAGFDPKRAAAIVRGVNAPDARVVAAQREIESRDLMMQTDPEFDRRRQDVEAHPISAAVTAFGGPVLGTVVPFLPRVVQQGIAVATSPAAGGVLGAAEGYRRGGLVSAAEGGAAGYGIAKGLGALTGTSAAPARATQTAAIDAETARSQQLLEQLTAMKSGQVSPAPEPIISGPITTRLTTARPSLDLTAGRPPMGTTSPPEPLPARPLPPQATPEQIAAARAEILARKAAASSAPIVDFVPRGTPVVEPAAVAPKTAFTVGDPDAPPWLMAGAKAGERRVLSPAAIRNELALQGRRQGVRLSPEQYTAGEAAVKAGAVPAEVVQRIKVVAVAPLADLSAAEQAEYVRILNSGKTPAEANAVVEANRAIRARFGTPSVEDAQAAVAERNATGRWGARR